MDGGEALQPRIYAKALLSYVDAGEAPWPCVDSVEALWPCADGSELIRSYVDAVETLKDTSHGLR